MIMLIAPAQFGGSLYAFLRPQLTVWAFVFATGGAAALLTALGVFRGRWVPLVFLAGSLPFIAMGTQLARAEVFSGLISYGLLGVTMLAAAIGTVRGRVGGRVLDLMFGLNQLAIGTALTVIPRQFDNAAVYGELSIGARPFLVPLLFLAGASLVLSVGLRSRRLQIVGIAVALMTCSVFAASFLSAHTWTGVMYYGVQVPFLVTLWYQRTTWRTVLTTLAALGAGFALANLLSGLGGAAGASMTEPVLGSALVVLCVLLAAHTGLRREVPGAPMWLIVLMLAGAVLLIRAIALAVGSAADGVREYPAGPAGLVLSAGGLWVATRSSWRWAPHLEAGVGSVVVAVALVNVVALMTGVESLEQSLGWLQMRVDSALILLVIGTGLLGVALPRVATGPIEGRIFTGFAAVMAIALIHKLLGDAALGGALDLAAGDPGAGRDLASAGSRAQGALLVVMGVIAIGTGTILARTITSPLRIIRQAIGAYAAGELQTRVPLFSDDQVGAIGSAFNDLADQVARSHEALETLNIELEERVERRTAELAAATKELEAFSYSVSHDLRAPLRSIDGFSVALLEDYEALLPAEGRHYLGQVRSAAGDMGRLIDDLLRLSMITRGSLRRQACDLSAMAREIVAQLASGDPSREVEVVIPEGLVATADPGLARRVLENLLGNAWKFSSRQQQSRIELGRLPGGDREFFVRDNGAGFDMAYADQLFGAFQRLHPQTEFPGSGIGLATVQRVIRRHRGTLRAEGAVGEGATFFYGLGDDGSEVPDAAA